MKHFFAYSTQIVSIETWKAKGNAKITLFELEQLVKSPQPEYFLRLRALYREGYESGNTDKINEAKAIKNTLPWFLGSGFCPVHHNNKTLEYNGFIQGDLDFKFRGGDACARLLVKVVRDLMERGLLPYVAFVCISPSGYGVKFLLHTDCTDIAQHGAAAAAVIAALTTALGGGIPSGGKFDKLGASQPIFVPYDQEAFFNHNTTPFHFVAPEPPPITDTEPKPTAAPQRHHSGTTDQNDLRAAYNFLLDSRAVLATCYAEYLPVLATCISAFENDGAAAAWALLENSPAFLVSDFRKKFDSHAKSIKNANTPAEWLFKQAWGHGWNGGHGHGDNAPKTILQGEAGEKLTGILARYGVELTGKRWCVPTGTGKTFAVAAFAKEGNKTILAVPTKALARNVAAEYGAVFWDGQNRPIVPGAVFYVTTYASLSALGSRLNAVADWNLFFDEAHNFTAAAGRGYMYKTLLKAVDFAPFFASVTTLTGTELETYHPLLLGLPQFEVRAPRTLQKTLEVVRTVNTLDAAAYGVAAAIKGGDKVVVALNDKGTKLAKLQARLKGIEGARVEYFNSENKDGEAFAALCKNGMFPEGINVIVTTSVLREGNNINDVSGFAFIFLGMFHAVEVEQLTARARRATSVKTVIIKGVENVEKAAASENFNKNKVRYMTEKEVKKRVEQLNAAGAAAGWSDFIRGVLTSGVRAYDQASEGRALPIIESTGVFEMDALLLANFVFEAEKSAQYNSDKLQETALRQYGFCPLRGMVVEVPSTVAPEVERAAVEAYKAKQQQEYDETLNRLDAYGVTPTTIQNELEQCKTKGGTRAALEVVARVVEKGLTVHDAIAAVRKYAHKPSKKKAGELCDLVTFCQIGDNLNKYRGTNEGRFVRDMKAAFKDGEIVSTAVFIARMEKVTGKRYDGDKRADKALRVARLVFDVRQTKKRLEGGGTCQGWRFCSVNFEYYNKKKEQKDNGTPPPPPIRNFAIS